MAENSADVVVIKSTAQQLPNERRRNIAPSAFFFQTSYDTKVCAVSVLEIVEVGDKYRITITRRIREVVPLKIGQKVAGAIWRQNRSSAIGRKA